MIDQETFAITTVVMGTSIGLAIGSGGGICIASAGSDSVTILSVGMIPSTLAVAVEPNRMVASRNAVLIVPNKYDGTVAAPWTSLDALTGFG